MKLKAFAQSSNVCSKRQLTRLCLGSMWYIIIVHDRSCRQLLKKVPCYMHWHAAKKYQPLLLIWWVNHSVYWVATAIFMIAARAGTPISPDCLTIAAM